jgi:hypothetical protein
VKGQYEIIFGISSVNFAFDVEKTISIRQSAATLKEYAPVRCIVLPAETSCMRFIEA